MSGASAVSGGETENKSSNSSTKVGGALHVSTISEQVLLPQGRQGQGRDVRVGADARHRRALEDVRSAATLGFFLRLV